MLVTVEIRHDAIYVMTNIIKGAGGYPVVLVKGIVNVIGWN